MPRDTNWMNATAPPPSSSESPLERLIADMAAMEKRATLTRRALTEKVVAKEKQVKTAWQHLMAEDE